MSEEWISAAEAFRLVAAATGPREAPRSICLRAYAGMIRAKAARFVMDRESRDDFEIPKEFWWAGGEAALTQNWVTGDFGTWSEKDVHFQAFGVLFSRKAIEAIAAPAIGSLLLAPVNPATNTGGRPAAAWWEIFG